ncbi:hypothetical protein CL634_05735 [bacterium]|nr:hypothetical protein [bacterium]
MTNQTTETTIMLSGGFDPIHIGHIRMILAAAKLGNVIVVLNSDRWLMEKKGYVFIPWDERAEIIGAIRGVQNIIGVNDTDGTVCAALKIVKPDIFGNGGDRTNKNTPEMDVCKALGIKMVWGLGGEKVQSSSELVEATNLVVSMDSEDVDLRPSMVYILNKTKE